MGTRSDFSVCLASAADRPIEESLAMLRRIGADRFGLLASTMSRQGWARSVDAVRACGLSADFIAGGVNAMADDDAGWSTNIAHLQRSVDAAAEIGAGTVCFTSGGSGFLSWEDAASAVVERFAPLVEHARRSGVALAVENTMSIRSGISFVHSVSDAAELAGLLGVGLCVDLYSAFQERGLMRTLADNLDAICLVQIGDHRVQATSVPNRWVPGDGQLPLERLVREVREIGYTGVVDLELLGPAIDAEGDESALARGLQWMRTFVP
ncbi:sugar phosphate isomerase/epimerase family protein [Rhodococcus sp. OK519]|uniref:sugar phosphate isomerase/epimerase family protein n=1 Tax=Rhodococcus sp. OK519 TaxID=2135729 RepID=UPI002159A583